MLALAQLCTVDPPWPAQKSTKRHRGRATGRAGQKNCEIHTEGSNFDVNTTGLCAREARLPAVHKGARKQPCCPCTTSTLLASVHAVAPPEDPDAS